MPEPETQTGGTAHESKGTEWFDPGEVIAFFGLLAIGFTCGLAVGVML